MTTASAGIPGSAAPTAALVFASVALLLSAGCSPGAGQWTRREGPAADRSGVPAAQVAGLRPRLLTVGRVHVHQVAIDLPGRSDVLMGRLRFPGPDALLLEASTPFGLRLFTLGFDGGTWSTEVAAPLRGRFDAERLAADIGHVYLSACPAGSEAVAEGAHWQLRCQRADGTDVVETLRRSTLELIQRRITEADGRVIEVATSAWAWFGPHRLPGRVELKSGDGQVTIALTAVEAAP